MFGIIKQDNGNVLFLGNGLNFSITPDCDVKQVFGNTIFISKEGNNIFSFQYNQVEYYTIAPSTAKVAPPADIDVFTALLQTSFFFAPPAFDGILINDKEATAAIIATPTATVSVTDIAQKNVLYLEPTLNCIMQGLESTGTGQGQLLLLVNRTTFSITIPEENVNPAPEDRFKMTGTSKTVPPGGAKQLMRDQDRWLIL